MAHRDPIQIAADGSRDLYDIVEWHPRTRLDSIAIVMYAALVTLTRSAIVALASLILAAEIVIGGLGTVTDPYVGGLTLLSVIPALALAGYVWRTDVTKREPLRLLVGTFLLGILFAGFAGVVNSVAGPAILGFSEGVGLSALGLGTFFFLVVAPVEEGVKLLAVRLYAFNDVRFDAVVDGAVYGAIAGLGFATIENAVYVTGAIGDAGTAAFATGGTIATVRALAGPGHVIYSAFAGYYLGLAKFNAEDAGPIVVKGLLIATLLHGSYNLIVSFLPELLGPAIGVAPIVAIFGVVIVYDGFLLWILFGKLRTYRQAYLATRAVDDHPRGVATTEFDP